MALSESGNQRMKVGGPCTYNKYPGKATIVSVTEAQPSSGYSKDKYEVKFTFKPEGEVQEPFVKTEGKTFHLTVNDGAYPGRAYLEKYGIKTGVVFDSVMNVIVKGTCTPVVFDFPAIQRQDPPE